MADDARRYIASAKAPATLRAYRSDWAQFATWCQLHDRVVLPADAETVALYLSDLARAAKPATLRRRLSSISQAHQAAGHQTPTADPVVRAVHAGIRRSKGTAPAVKAPAVTAELRAMIEHLPADLRGTRDRALLLVGFAAALRRSELVALDCSDVADTAEGLVVILRRSKTDQEGAGRKIGVPYGSNPATCPVRALRAWTELAGFGGQVPRPRPGPWPAAPRAAAILDRNRRMLCARRRPRWSPYSTRPPEDLRQAGYQLAGRAGPHVATEPPRPPQND